jgi:hypothetical protein
MLLGTCTPHDYLILEELASLIVPTQSGLDLCSRATFDYGTTAKIAEMPAILIISDHDKISDYFLTYCKPELYTTSNTGH